MLEDWLIIKTNSKVPNRSQSSARIRTGAFTEHDPVWSSRGWSDGKWRSERHI